MKRVLVAENDPLISKLINTTLYKEFELQFCEDNAAVLQALHEQSDFALVIIDYELFKSENSAAFIESLQQAPLILLAKRQSATLPEELDSNRVTLVMKPFSPIQFLTLARSLAKS
ncbi:MAG: hypothetical protein AB1489_25865 [Acidobacteriota bacterium]